MSIAKMETYINLKPICGFCKEQIKELPAMTEDGVTIHVCAKCGAVLGVTKER